VKLTRSDIMRAAHARIRRDRPVGIGVWIYAATGGCGFGAALRAGSILRRALFPLGRASLRLPQRR